MLDKIKILIKKHIKIKKDKFKLSLLILFDELKIFWSIIIFPPTRKLIFKKVSIKKRPINKKQDFINGEFEDIEDENDRKL